MEQMEGAIVVVAKCPIQGHCKTRLQPLLGEKGATLLAKALLSDTLVAISSSHNDLHNVKKILCYAPPTAMGLEIMEGILEDLRLYERFGSQWDLLPMLPGNLQESNLGSRLADALTRIRHLLPPNSASPIIYLGMDSPEVPLDEIISALKRPNRAHLCPSDDGGYGLLSVPHHASEEVFHNVRWSHSLTALSQLKALTDCGVDVSLGRLMHDIDTPDDLHDLCERLRGFCPTLDDDCLTQSTQPIPQTAECKYTIEALQKLGYLG